jgi:hypothetical protein
MKLRGLVLAAVLLARWDGFAAESEWKQQFSAWFSLNDDTPSTPRLALRYQPDLSMAVALGGRWKLDGEASLDIHAAGSAPGWRSPDFSGAIKPYRLWLRLSSQRFEARLGLQKINFGSATIFRPLMWFDALDLRDPLQISYGVYGLLLRYYFKNNANLWLWGLYGNQGTKGWETRPTAEHTPEFGARFQAPLFSGEAGLTFHRRRLAPGGVDGEPVRRNEERFALDGKWDLGIGLWVESAFSRQDDPTGGVSWQRSSALGIDYTFKLGNGLYLLAEQFLSQTAASPLTHGEGGLSLSALQARYPLGLLDNLSLVFYYDWRNKQTYSLASWQRTYDRWQFLLLAFWNPRQGPIIGVQSGNNAFSGKGFQLMAIWNI